MCGSFRIVCLGAIKDEDLFCCAFDDVVAVGRWRRRIADGRHC